MITERLSGLRTNAPLCDGIERAARVAELYKQHKLKSKQILNPSHGNDQSFLTGLFHLSTVLSLETPLVGNTATQSLRLIEEELIKREQYGISQNYRAVIGELVLKIKLRRKKVLYEYSFGKASLSFCRL